MGHHHHHHHDLASQRHQPSHSEVVNFHRRPRHSRSAEYQFNRRSDVRNDPPLTFMWPTRPRIEYAHQTAPWKRY